MALKQPPKVTIPQGPERFPISIGDYQKAKKEDDKGRRNPWVMASTGAAAVLVGSGTVVGADLAAHALNPQVPVPGFLDAAVAKVGLGDRNTQPGTGTGTPQVQELNDHPVNDALTPAQKLKFIEEQLKALQTDAQIKQNSTFLLNLLKQNPNWDSQIPLTGGQIATLGQPLLPSQETFGDKATSTPIMLTGAKTVEQPDGTFKLQITYITKVNGTAVIDTKLIPVPDPTYNTDTGTLLEHGQYASYNGYEGLGGGAGVENFVRSFSKAAGYELPAHPTQEQWAKAYAAIINWEADAKVKQAQADPTEKMMDLLGTLGPDTILTIAVPLTPQSI